MLSDPFLVGAAAGCATSADRPLVDLVGDLSRHLAYAIG